MSKFCSQLGDCHEDNCRFDHEQDALDEIQEDTTTLEEKLEEVEEINNNKTENPR